MTQEQLESVGNEIGDKLTTLADRMTHHVHSLEFIADNTKDRDLSSVLCSVLESMETSEELIQGMISLNPPQF